MNKKFPYKEVGMLAMKTAVAIFAIIGLEDFIRLLAGGMI